jgi:hypothetical protein
MTQISFGYKSLDNGGMRFLTEAIPWSLTACNKSRKADGEKPAQFLSFDGETAIDAKAISDLLKLGCGSETVILTPGKRELCDPTHRYTPNPLIATGYWLTEGLTGAGYSNSWRAFLRSKPIIEEMEYLTAYWQPEPVEQREIDPWPQLAVSHDQAHPELCTIGGNVAADGFRIHYLRDAAPIEWGARTRAESILDSARHNQTKVHLNQLATKELLTVCKRAAKMKHPLHLSVSGRLEYAVHDEEFGGTSGYITGGYQHVGEDMHILVNPKYLADAIGKPGIRTWILLDPGKPIYLTDGVTREAVLMTMSE